MPGGGAAWLLQSRRGGGTGDGTYICIYLYVNMYIYLSIYLSISISISICIVELMPGGGARPGCCRVGAAVAQVTGLF